MRAVPRRCTLCDITFCIDREKYSWRGSKPLLSSKIDEHADNHSDHHCPNERISPLPFQFWHVPEIHSINAYHECQWYENSGDDRQYLHYRIHPIANTREINIQQI